VDAAIEALKAQDEVGDTISRQAAIDVLKGLEFRQYIGEDTREVCLIRAEKAQDALQSLPSAQPTDEEIQTMQEIEQAQIQKAFALGREDAESKFAGAYYQVRWERDVAVEQLKELGYSLGEKIRHGHWMPLELNETPYTTCSVCESLWEKDLSELFSFCPNCGARMDERSEG